MAKTHIPGAYTLEAEKGNLRAALKAAGAKDGAKVVMVPPASILRPEGLNPRFWGSPKTKAHIEGIAKSMISRGEQGLAPFMEIHPIGALARKWEGKDALINIDGWHRHAAVELANKRVPGLIELVPTIIVEADVTDAQLALMFVTANNAEKLDPYGVAVSIQRAADAGMTKKEIMAELGISERYLYDLGLLHQADPRIIELVAAGRIASTLVIDEIKEFGQEKAAKRLLKATEKAADEGKARTTARHVKAAVADDLGLGPAKKPAPKEGEKATKRETPADDPAAPVVPVKAAYEATLDALEAVFAHREQFGESDDRLTKIMHDILRVGGGDDLVLYAVAVDRYEHTGLVALGLVEVPEETPATAQEEPAQKAQKETSKRRSSKKTDSKPETPPADVPVSPAGSAEGL